MSVTSDEFKQALGRWATGVTIVTARDGETIHGMTVSAFTEVSLAPPLVLFCADKSANTLPLVQAGRVFAVNVLARDQDGLSNRFASKRDEWRRFEGVDWDAGETGAPLLRGAVSNLDCRVVAQHDHGDHIVVVGEVVSVQSFDREPLLYFSGRYGSIAD